MASKNNKNTKSAQNKENTKDLYNDLPNDVKDILSETHSFVGNKNSNKNSEDINLKDTDKITSKNNKSSSYQDKISNSGSAQKSSITEEITLNIPFSKKQDDSLKEFDEINKNRFENLDFESRLKKEHLDNLYDDYEDDDHMEKNSKLFMILGAVALILIVFLIFKCVSLSSKLEEAENQISVNKEIATKYEELQLEKMQLEEQLNGTASPNSEKGSTDDKNSTDKTNEKNTGSSNSNKNTTEYTVVAGDTVWEIAKKTLGDGSKYQKILDANGLKESDPINIGTKLKIPKA